MFNKQNKTIDDVLTKEQDDKAFAWLNDHVIHVMNLIMREDNNGKMFPPTREDKSQPNQWKPNHWMWYAKNKKLKINQT